MRSRLRAGAFLLLLLVLATGCLGPKPVLVSYQATPPQGAGLPFQVEAVIANQGPGSGTIRVTVKLTNKQTGATLAEDEKTVGLEQDEKQHLFFQIDLPPSAQNLDPANIGVEITPEYPIE